MQFERALIDQAGRETLVRVIIDEGELLAQVVAVLAMKAKESRSGSATMAYGAIRVEVIE